MTLTLPLPVSPSIPVRPSVPSAPELPVLRCYLCQATTRLGDCACFDGVDADPVGDARTAAWYASL